MSPVLIIVSAMFVCQLALMFMVDQVRVTLSLRHPQVWRDLKAQTSFFRHPVFEFIRRRQDKALGDSDLTSKTQLAWRLHLVQYCGMVIFCVAALSGRGTDALW